MGFWRKLMRRLRDIIRSEENTDNMKKSLPKTNSNKKNKTQRSRRWKIYQSQDRFPMLF